MTSRPATSAPIPDLNSRVSPVFDRVPSGKMIRIFSGLLRSSEQMERLRRTRTRRAKGSAFVTTAATRQRGKEAERVEMTGMIGHDDKRAICPKIFVPDDLKPVIDAQPAADDQCDQRTHSVN